MRDARRRIIGAWWRWWWCPLLLALLSIFHRNCCFASTTTNTSTNTPSPNGTIYIPIPDSSFDSNTFSNVTVTPLSGFPRRAYRVDVTANAVTVLTPTPKKKHHDRHLVKASIQARRASCVAAVNGGPFHADGSSVGVLVQDGMVQQTDDHAAHLVGIGLVKMKKQHPNKHRRNHTAAMIHDDYNNNQEAEEEETSAHWILGAPPLDLQNVQFYVTGFGWLVYQNLNAVSPDNDNDTTGAVRAPRTAVGVNKAGDLVFVVADGCERCLRKRGLTLYELGEHLVHDLELEYAINLDGGSSTVLIDHDGKVRSHPTCLDVVSYKCERPVATVFCLGRPKTRTMIRETGSKRFRNEKASSQ